MIKFQQGANIFGRGGNIVVGEFILLNETFSLRAFVVVKGKKFFAPLSRKVVLVSRPINYKSFGRVKQFPKLRKIFAESLFKKVAPASDFAFGGVDYRLNRANEFPIPMPPDVVAVAEILRVVNRGQYFLGNE